MPSIATESDGQDRQIEGLHGSSTATSPLAKVLITATGSDLVDHHIVVPLSKSYPDTLRLATALLGEYLGASPVPQDFSLKYGMKSAAGNVVWADIVPQLWKDVVANGDELRLVKRGCEPEPVRQPLAALVTFEFRRRNSGSVLDQVYLCEVAPAPRCYKDAQIYALSMAKSFMENKNPSVYDIDLHVVVKDSEGKPAESSLKQIRNEGWMEFLALVKNEHSHLVFRVRETQASKNKR